MEATNLETAEGHESLNRRFEPPGFQEGEHGGFNALNSVMSGVNTLEVFLENGLHGRVWQDQLAQVTHMGLTPIGFALVTETVAEEKTFETVTATAVIIDRVGASATQIANGLVGGFGDVDSGQFTSTQQTGQAAGIAFVGFEWGSGLFGDERGRGDQARNFELFETAGDDKTARTGFIGNFQNGARVSFADALQSFFQSVEVIGDGAEEADLAFGAGFGDGDGDGVFVDIKTEMECNSFQGVVDCFYSHDESERIPRLQRGRSCGSAHPGNPRNNERQPHRFFQP
jgi:hypothetical protein